MYSTQRTASIYSWQAFWLFYEVKAHLQVFETTIFTFILSNTKDEPLRRLLRRSLFSIALPKSSLSELTLFVKSLPHRITRETLLLT